MGDAILIVGAAVYGLVIGSFLNVVIYRVPLKQSIMQPPSSCRGCGRHIAPRDNIPVLSWLILRGRCRSCGEAISARYPLVELLTALLFVGVALRFGWSFSLVPELAFVSGLVALAFCDLDHLLLPKRIIYPTGLAVLAGVLLAAAVDGSWHRLVLAIACGVVEFVVLFAIHVISPRAMGFGDVRLAPVLGLALGWVSVSAAIIGFFAANLLGALIGVALIVSRRATRRTAVPFGTFLAAGAILALGFTGALHVPRAGP